MLICSSLTRLATTLTATSPATFQDAFIATLYPPGAPATKGWLWAVDPYGGGSDDEVSPIAYDLIGAAWTRE